MNPPSASSRVLHSLVAAIGSQFWRVGVTFLTTLVLRRLLDPREFGLLGWSEALFLIVGALRDFGLPAHIVRSQPRPWGQFLRVEAWAGLGLSVLSLGLAPVLVRLWASPEPELVPLLQVLALLVILEGLASVPVVFLEAELQVSRALVPEVLRNLCYSATSIVLAWLGFGVASVAIGRVLSVGLFAVLLWSRVWRKLPFRAPGVGILKLLRGAFPIWIVWFVWLLNDNLDPLVVGAVAPAGVVGIYTFAYYVAFLASRILISPVSRVSYATMVRSRDAPERVFAAYRLATLALLAAEVPVALFLFCNAESVLALLGGTRWGAGAVYLRILCFAPLCDPFSRFGGDLMLVRGEDRRWIRAALFTLVAFAFLGITLAHTYGPLGMAVADLLPLGGIYMALSVRRAAPGEFAALVGALRFVYLAPVPLFAAVWWIGRAGPTPGLIAGLVAMAASFLVYHRRFGAEIVGFFRAAE